MSTEWNLAISGIISIAVAYIAFRAAVRKHFRTTKDSDKSIYVTAVTNERAKWRDELRRAVARFCGQAIEERPNIATLQELKTEILLRLNPNAFAAPDGEKHKFDRDVTLALGAIFGDVRASGVAASVEQITELELAAQKLLKQEWEVSKDEAQLGGRDANDASARILALRRVFSDSAPSASTQIPLPIVFGVIGILVHLVFPSLIGGWPAFAIGFASGVVLLFFAGYYDTSLAVLAGDASNDSEKSVVPDPELRSIKITGIASIVPAENSTEARPTDRERSQ